MKKELTNVLFFSMKLVTFALIICSTIIFINWCRKQDERRVKYRYIGNSIFETPNTMPKDCTVGEMEYKEHLVEFKP